MAAIRHLPNSLNFFDYPILENSNEDKYDDYDNSIVCAIITYILLVLKCCSFPDPNVCVLPTELKESSIKIIYDYYVKLKLGGIKMYWKILIKLLKNTEYNIYGTRKIPQSKYKKISNIIDDIIDDIVIDNIKDKRELKKSNKKEELYYTKLYFLLSYNIIYQDYNIIINEDHVLDVLKYNNMIQLLLVSQVNDLFTNIISVIQNKNLIICRKQCLNKIKNLNYYFARKTNDSFRILTIGLMGFGTCITCKGIKQINNIIKKIGMI